MVIDYIRPICVPEDDDVPATLTVSGWGRTEIETRSNIKREVEVPLVVQDQCKELLPRNSRVVVGQNQVCAGGVQGKDACQGDSGGPLMSPDKAKQSRWIQHGIISHGFGCGGTNQMGIYTRINRYVNWIFKSMFTTITQAPINEEICGLQKNEIDEHEHFPWLALLQYQYNDGTDAGLLCQGNLINDRFVITAARCILTSHLGYMMQTVRLGQWNASYVCEPDHDCHDNATVVPIAELFPHPSYDRHTDENDIGLIFLQTSVTYNHVVRPICFPANEDDLTTYNKFVAGWNKQDNTGSLLNTKNKVEVRLISNEDCLKHLSADSNQAGVSQKEVCDDVLDDTKSDLFSFGAPLMTSHRDQPNRWILNGIFSRKLNCTSPKIPNVYTKVYQYNNWINKVVSSQLLSIYSVNCNSNHPQYSTWNIHLYYEFEDKTFDRLCEGALISNKYALTSAHCFRSAATTQPSVYKASIDGQGYPVSLTVPHPEYNTVTGENDIGLVQINALMYSFRQPICLVYNATASAGDIFSTDATFNKKQKLQVSLANDSGCRSRTFSSITQLCSEGIEEQNLCKTKENVVLTSADKKTGRRILIGLSTGKFGCNTTSVAYTRVSYYIYWIYRSIKNIESSSNRHLYGSIRHN